eukprot:Skav201648  [mRNA]  locus=scaffold3160:68164:75089:+ [translate_table: standard]
MPWGPPWGRPTCVPGAQPWACEVVEAVLQYAEAKQTKAEPMKAIHRRSVGATMALVQRVPLVESNGADLDLDLCYPIFFGCDVIDDLCGRWEAVWSGAFTPLNRLGLPRQSLWVEVTAGQDGQPPVATAHSGLPLVLFGAYLWTSCAGDLLEVESSGSSQVLIQFTRYWIDIGPEPRADLGPHSVSARGGDDANDIGRVDGGFINSRLSAFGAALVTPVLLEFGALKWLLERLPPKQCCALLVSLVEPQCFAKGS